MKKWLAILRIVTLVSSWWAEASQDETITNDEIADIILQIAKSLNFNWDITFLTSEDKK